MLGEIWRSVVVFIKLSELTKISAEIDDLFDSHRLTPRS